MGYAPHSMNCHLLFTLTSGPSSFHVYMILPERTDPGLEQEFLEDFQALSSRLPLHVTIGPEKGTAGVPSPSNYLNGMMAQSPRQDVTFPDIAAVATSVRLTVRVSWPAG